MCLKGGRERILKGGGGDRGFTIYLLVRGRGGRSVEQNFGKLDSVAFDNRGRRGYGRNEYGMHLFKNKHDTRI